jgi:hypothetical protein
MRSGAADRKIRERINLILREQGSHPRALTEICDTEELNPALGADYGT